MLRYAGQKDPRLHLETTSLSLVRAYERTSQNTLLGYVPQLYSSVAFI